MFFLIKEEIESSKKQNSIYIKDFCYYDDSNLSIYRETSSIDKNTSNNGNRINESSSNINLR